MEITLLIEILFYLFLLAGSFILLISILFLRKFIGNLKGTAAYKDWRYLLFLTVFFLASYIAIIPLAATKNIEVLYIVLSLLLLLGSVFVYIISHIGSNTIKEFNRTSEAVASANINMVNLYAELEHAKNTLEEKNNEIAQAYTGLKEAQFQLVEMEKMAALGQLVAGIGHEINTPIGAINAANTNMLFTLEDQFSKIVETLRILDQKQWLIFNDLLNQALDARQQLTSKDERTCRKALQTKLEDHNINNADDIADTLVDMHIYSLDDEYIDSLKSSNLPLILSSASALFNLVDNTEIIKIAVEKVKKIIFALKNYTHYEHNSELVPVDIVENIDLVLTLYQNQLKYNIEVKRNYQPVSNVSGHPDELNQIWTNLIHNAIQAMSGKGELAINVYQDGNYVCVEVKDTGEGILEENFNKIFDAFYTTKKRGDGSGLGLNIVKKIVEKHNGNIILKSKPGETIFTIKIPVNENH